MFRTSEAAGRVHEKSFSSQSSYGRAQVRKTNRPLRGSTKTSGKW